MADRLTDTDTLTTTVGRIRKAAADCSTAEAALRVLYPEAFDPKGFNTSQLDEDKDDIVWIDPADGERCSIICSRNGGNYRNRSFFLNDTYFTWELVKDDHDYTVLVPTRIE